MKILMVMVGIALLCLAGCHLFNGKAGASSFIPGVYIAQWKGEFSETRDTMIIAALRADGNTRYAITRRTFILYTHVSLKRAPEYKLARWTGTYDENAGTLFIDNNGRVLSFDPVEKEMIMGIVRYKKL